MCGERSRRSVQQARGGRGETYVHTPRSQQSPLVVYRRETFRRLLIFWLDSEQLKTAKHWQLQITILSRTVDCCAAPRACPRLRECRVRVYAPRAPLLASPHREFRGSHHHPGFPPSALSHLRGYVLIT